MYYAEYVVQSYAERELQAYSLEMANYNYFCLVTLVKGLRKVLRVSWTAKKTNEWVLNKAGVKRELLDTVKDRKLAYCGYTMKKQGNRLKK